MGHSKLWKIQEMAIPDHLACLLRNLYAGQEATEPDMEQLTDSKLGREYVKGDFAGGSRLFPQKWAGWGEGGSGSWLSL